MIITDFCIKRCFFSKVKKFQIFICKMQCSYAISTCSVQQNRPGARFCTPGRFGSF